MKEDAPFHHLDDCQQVALILDGILPTGFESFFLWRARAHAGSCIPCQQRYPNAITFLSDQTNRLEAALALEIEEIRGDHIREASAIGREAILSRQDGGIFALDDRLLYSPVYEQETASERAPALALITSLAKAGCRVKKALETIHGEGLVWFNVVVNLNDGEQEHAWRECAGLIRRLSKESRDFAFSAALAAEVFQDLAWDPDPRMPSGVHMGVLYKAIQTAANRYAETYLSQNPQGPIVQPLEPSIHSHRETTEVRPQGHNIAETREDQTEFSQQVIENLLEGQTAMMGSLEAIEKAARALLDASRQTSDAAKSSCEATLRDALESQFDRLAASTRDFLLAAEYGYTQFPVALDFSSVVVNLTKAFEFEFRRAIEPSLDELQQIAISDVSFMGDLSVLALGGFLRLLRQNKLTVEPLFQQRGLVYADVCTAISQVNKEKGAKHLAKITKADATRFRALFLGKPSILAALSSSR